MRVKNLIKTKEEYLDLAWNWYLWAETSRSIWKEEDLAKLEPFLFWDKKRGSSGEQPMSEEVGTSFYFYQQCRKDYADNDLETRDSLYGNDICHILEEMRLELNEEDAENEDRPFNKYDIKFIDLMEPLKFPFVLSGYIVNDFNRIGPVKGCFFEMISLEDFNVGVVN